MSEEDHEQFGETLRRCKGKVLVSGYPSELYSHMFKGWRTATFDMANHATGGAAKRRKTETL